MKNHDLELTRFSFMAEYRKRIRRQRLLYFSNMLLGAGLVLVGYIIGKNV